MFVDVLVRVNSPKYGKSESHDFFLKWENAQAYMDEKVNDLMNYGGKIVRQWDKMNTEKGFYEYQKDMVLEDEEGHWEYTFALLERLFKDED